MKDMIKDFVSGSEISILKKNKLKRTYTSNRNNYINGIFD